MPTSLRAPRSRAPTEVTPRVRDWVVVWLDAVAVSVERRRDPSLSRRPVVVVRPGATAATDPAAGAVVAVSDEARSRGVRVGSSLARAAALCPAAAFVPADEPAYEAAAAELFAAIATYAPAVERTGRDEGVLDVTGWATALGVGPGEPYPTWLDAAAALRDDLGRRTGLAVTVGVAGSRTVARVAAQVARPRGVIEVPRGAEAAFLSGFPVDVLPGVPPRAAAVLAGLGAGTVGDVAALPVDVLVAHLGADGPLVAAKARGEDDEPARASGPPRTLARVATLPHPLDDRAQLAEVAAGLARRASGAVRALGLAARAVVVEVHDAVGRSYVARRRLDAPRDDEAAFVRAAGDAVHALPPARASVRLAVVLHGLVASPRRTPGLFDDLA